MKRFNYWCVVLCAALGIGALAGADDALIRTGIAVDYCLSGRPCLDAGALSGAGGSCYCVPVRKNQPALAKGDGLVFDAARNREAQIPAVLIPLVMVSTWLTHLFGRAAPDGKG